MAKAGQMHREQFKRLRLEGKEVALVGVAQCVVDTIGGIMIAALYSDPRPCETG